MLIKHTYMLWGTVDPASVLCIKVGGLGGGGLFYPKKVQDIARMGVFFSHQKSVEKGGYCNMGNKCMSFCKARAESSHQYLSRFL